VRQSAIADSVWVALVVFGVRLVAIMSGSWLGCKMGGVKSELQRRCFWLSMVTQVSTRHRRAHTWCTHSYAAALLDFAGKWQQSRYSGRLQAAGHIV
jgi:hypothetical protein